MLPWLLKGGIASFRTSRPLTHFARGALSYLGMLLSYYSVTLISLADSNALQFTLPFFTFLYAMWLLNERISLHRWVAMAVGFAGVLVIVRPGFADVNIGVFVAIAAAATYGLSDVMTRMLSRTESTNLIMFYTFVLPAPLGLIPALFFWTWPGWPQTVAILVFSASATLASYSLTRAFTAAETSVVSPVLYVRLPIVAAFGWYFFDQPTDIWTWIGSAIIFAATLALARREAHIASRTPAKSA
jgi:drug/metabolite transporter (DMT)-like permease